VSVTQIRVYISWEEEEQGLFPSETSGDSILNRISGKRSRSREENFLQVCRNIPWSTSTTNFLFSEAKSDRLLMERHPFGYSTWNPCHGGDIVDPQTSFLPDPRSSLHQEEEDIPQLSLTLDFTSLEDTKTSKDRLMNSGLSIWTVNSGN